MIYTFMPSLQHLAVVRTAIELWNHEDNRDLLLKDLNYSPKGFQNIVRVWPKVENKVIGKVPKLKLPQSLENKILNVIKPIGIEILKWCLYHENLFKNDRKQIRRCINKLCWTPQGTVDSKKAAEMLINDENFTVSNRYKLACIYCLENYVQELWNKLSETRQSYFYRRRFRRKKQDLVVFWTYYIKGEEAKLENMISDLFDLVHNMSPEDRIRVHQNYTLYVHMILVSAANSKSATEYFMKKLNCEQKEEILVKMAHKLAFNYTFTSSFREQPYYQPNSEIFLFLCSQIQNTVINEDAIYLLDWPWQNVFVETRKPNSKLIICLHVFVRMVDKVINGFRDYNYLQLLRETWQVKMDYVNLPDRSFYEEPLFRTLLLKLLLIDDKETFELILQDTIPSIREHIFCNIDLDIFESLVISDKWDSLKYLILKLEPSKCKMVEFKEEITQYIMNVRTKRELEEEKDLWNKFYTFVDQLAEEIDKESCSEERDSKLAIVHFLRIGVSISGIFISSGLQLAWALVNWCRFRSYQR